MSKKAIMDKQFCYLVLAVLQLIVSYYIQFSFISLGVCHKWDIMVKKGLRAKTGLSCDFSSEVLHHLSLYSLKPFKQVQSEKKLASLISFSNGRNILEHLFDHRFLDLQVLRWSFLNLLQFPVRLCISPVNNFLAEVVKIFLENNLSLMNNLSCPFYESDNFLMFGILGQFLIFDKKGKLDPRGPVPCWFFLTSDFMNKSVFLGVRTTSASRENVLSVLDSDRFFDVCDSLLEMWFDCIEVYTDRSLKCAGSAEMVSGVTAYFPAVDAAMVLVLKCVPSSCLVVLYSNSQAVIDVCISKASVAIKKLHINNLFESKNISIKWVKVKSHSDVLGNVKADALVNEATSSFLSMLVRIQKRFLVTEKTAISGNASGLGFDVIPDVMIKKIDWGATATIWYPNSHMLSEFTSRKSANLCTYLIKTVYRQLLVAVKKRLYNKSYSGVLCLLYGKMELSDHVFICSDNSGLYIAVCKRFVVRDLYAEAVLVFKKQKKTTLALVEYIRFVVELYHTKVWTVRAKHRMDIEKAGLVGDNSLVCLTM
ncbi:hypothetical protein G9A89_006606 [Geosiphon pyriformis]|nr:hypothetical protein G9A89_006606 [Geosiphon pyriformis]